ncbi:hypothetical protein [Silvibacterium dinghuense]|uniref:hypothetical protein n=1 Tax=Silvibacterium dinghuense TaxID=1560006 RepID=UPI0013E90C60|nr:hypothetical protein [Silvibacterium dinghuense]GGH06747.1 hypothetical protein GCM10011586_23660 [Silvibacterium dinghuense]
MDLIVVFSVIVLLFFAFAVVHEAWHDRKFPRDTGMLFLTWLLVICGATFLGFLAS